MTNLMGFDNTLQQISLLRADAVWKAPQTG